MTLIEAIHDAGLTDAFVLIGALFVVCCWLFCVYLLLSEVWRWLTTAAIAAWRE